MVLSLKSNDDPSSNGDVVGFCVGDALIRLFGDTVGDIVFGLVVGRIVGFIVGGLVDG